MSQRSAFSAAASATAEVSEPPRPSVVMRLSGADALEAGDHGDLAGLHPADQLRALDRRDARLAVRGVGEDRDLPALPGAGLDADLLQRDRQQAGGHLLAGGHHGVVLPRVVQRRQLLAPGDQLVGDAGHGGDHDRDLLPASTSRFTRCATLRMRSRSATEVPPNFITMRAMFSGSVVSCCEVGAHILARDGRGNNMDQRQRSRPTRSHNSTVWRRAGGIPTGR